jgi:hypothetical protein
LPLPDPPTVDRYVAVLDAAIASAGDALAAAPAAERLPADRPPATVAVERGVAWPMLAHDPGSAAAFDLLAPLLERSFDPESAVVVDRAGHSRPAYRGLLGYALFQAVGASDRVLLGEQAAAAERWLAALRADLGSVGTDSRGGAGEAGGDEAGARDGIAASRGGDAVRAAWSAAAVRAGGELCHDDAATRAAGRCLLGIVARQQPAGHFLRPDAGDNLESFWFHELQLLHAVAASGLQSRDPAALSAAARSAAYHLAETQPDHATNEPWGLPGFLCDPDAVVMADQVLHAAGVQQPGRAGGVTLILLADTLYSLRRSRAR